MAGGQPHRVTANGDLFDSAVAGYVGTLKGVKLTAGSAAAAAQLVDADGIVLVDLSCVANGADTVPVHILFKRKVTVQGLTGAGAIVSAWI